MRKLLAAFVAVSLGASPALATIRIADSFYENGVLTVTGQARPGQNVKLDGKYETKADAGGHFEFHIRYKPPTCMPDITAGEDTYSAIITNCLLGDAAASEATVSTHTEK